jgi:hypothetical protein
MRKALAVVLALGLINAPLLEGASAARPNPVASAAAQESSYYEPYSPDQLDNLLAPIALYPDPLLAQVLLAATFADQVDEAARYVRAYGQGGIDGQPWDVSVRAVAHYPTVLYMMADKLDWTIAVGQAYANQSTDVMTSVQRLRAMAQAQGNLITTPQQQVVVESGFIYIWPWEPPYLYVPVYDPYLVYYRRWPGWGPVFVSFTVGFLIGAWLNYDCDWYHHRVFYTGWQGRGWIERYRPHIRINDVYVNQRYRNVYVNREISRRNVNYYNLNRYNSVHRDVKFDNRARDRNIYKPNPRVNNQVIQRNIDTGNPQLDRYRGHEQPGRAAPPSERAAPQPPTRPTLPAVARPAPQPPARPAQPPISRPTAPAQVRPQPPPQPQAQPQPQPQQQPGAFNRGTGNFPARATSQRGQTSRSEARQPARSAPSPPSAPRSAPPRSAPAPQQRPSGRSR